MFYCLLFYEKQYQSACSQEANGGRTVMEVYIVYKSNFVVEARDGFVPIQSILWLIRFGQYMVCSAQGG